MTDHLAAYLEHHAERVAICTEDGDQIEDQAQATAMQGVQRQWQADGRPVPLVDVYRAILGSKEDET